MNKHEIEYTKLFDDPKYNLHSNNELRFNFVINYIKNKKLKTLIDIGSGRGNLIKKLLEEKISIDITSVDLNKFHELNVPFYKLNIMDEYDRQKLLKENFDLLTCLDVMEHLEKNFTDDIFKFFSKISKFQILTIANHPNIQNGKDIHTIQENLTFWIDSIKKSLNIIEIKRVRFFSNPDEFPELKRFNYLYIFITSSKSNVCQKKTIELLIYKLVDNFLNFYDKMILKFK